MTYLEKLAAMVAAMTKWPNEPWEFHLIHREEDRAGIVALVNAAPELLRLARVESDLVDFARHVTVHTKHRSPDCTPEHCSKCRAEQILLREVAMVCK